MVIKNLENKIRLVGIICTAFLVGCVIISLSSIWTARTMVSDAQKKVYVLDGNVPILVKEVSAGRKFAQATRIDKAAAKVQGFANAHRILFLVIVFGFAIGGFTWNIYRITMAYRNSRPTRTATEMQDSVLRERHKRLQGGEIRENRNENKKYEPQ